MLKKKKKVDCIEQPPTPFLKLFTHTHTHTQKIKNENKKKTVFAFVLAFMIVFSPMHFLFFFMRELVSLNRKTEQRQWNGRFFFFSPVHLYTFKKKKKQDMVQGERGRRLLPGET